MDKLFHRHKRSKSASNSLSTPVTSTRHHHSGSLTGNERALPVAPLGTPARVVKGVLKRIPQIVAEHDDWAVVGIGSGDVPREVQRAQPPAGPPTPGASSSRRERRLTPMPSAHSSPSRPSSGRSLTGRSSRTPSAVDHQHNNSKSDSAITSLGLNTAPLKLTHRSRPSHSLVPSTYNGLDSFNSFDSRTSGTTRDKAGLFGTPTRSVRRTGTLENPVSAKATTFDNFADRESVFSSYATDDSNWSSLVKPTDGNNWLPVVQNHQRLSVTYGSESSGSVYSRDSGYTSGSVYSQDSSYTTSTVRGAGSDYDYIPSGLTLESSAPRKGSVATIVSRASSGVLPREGLPPPRPLASNLISAPAPALRASPAPRHADPTRKFPSSSAPLPPIPPSKSELRKNGHATFNAPSPPTRPPHPLPKPIHQMTEKELNRYYLEIRDRIVDDCGRWLENQGKKPHTAWVIYDRLFDKSFNLYRDPVRAARYALDRVMLAVEDLRYEEVDDPRYAEVLLMSGENRVRRKKDAERDNTRYRAVTMAPGARYSGAQQNLPMSPF